MKIIDTIISREALNSPWTNVVFVGDRGETVSVRLPCSVPTGGPVGRGRIIKNAATLLRSLVEGEAFDRLGEQAWSTPTERFGAAPPKEPWRNGSTSGEE